MAIEQTPYWWRDAPPNRAESQPVQVSCDVVIIGAGYTGLSAAHVLAEAGQSVQVFDKDIAGAAASSRNGGITSGNLRFSVAGAVKAFGRDRAAAMFREGVAARAHLAAFITDHGIECDDSRCGRFTGALNPADLEEMKRTAEALHEIAGIETGIVERSGLSSVIGSEAYVGGSLRPDIGLIQPARFLAGLLRVARHAGAVVHDETAVTQVVRAGDGYRVTTARGSVQAGQVIVATNGYGDGSDRWLQRRMIPIASRIVVTEELSENLVRELIPDGRGMGEKRKLFRYFRATPDGRRILMGAREPAMPASADTAARHVISGLVQVFPQLRDVAVTHSWAGYTGFSRSELPCLFQRDGVHYAMGYCGSGTVWAPWLGRQAALKVLGRYETRSAFDTDAPKAVPFYQGRPWFLPFAIALNGVQDRLAGRS